MATSQANYETVTITPKMAAQWIAETGNRNFRKSSESRVNQYASDMRRRRWRLTGQGIVKNGKIVLDGMHRLRACVLADVPFKTLVVTGISASIVSSLDDGRSRSLCQEFKYRGIKNAAVHASVTSNWYGYREGKWKMRATTSHVSRRTLLEFYEDNNDVINDACSMLMTSYDGFEPRCCIQGSILGPILCEGTSDHFEVPSASCDAHSFCEELATGECESKTSSAIQLRNLGFRQESTNSDKQTTLIMRRALSIHAWNLYMAGEVESKLRYRLAGRGAKEFPVINQSAE